MLYAAGATAQIPNVTFKKIPTATPRTYFPYIIAPGPGESIWFLDSLQIGFFDLSGAVTMFPISPTPNDTVQPSRLTLGPDGNLWFTAGIKTAGVVRSVIGRCTPNGTITYFTIPTAVATNGVPSCDGISNRCDITGGPDGNVWFILNRSDIVGRITPQGSITEFPTPGGVLNRITRGPDGNLWMTSSSRIYRVTTSGAITVFNVTPSRSFIGYEAITAGPDGNLYFTETGSGGNRIGRITPSGTITEFPIPTPNSNPLSITAGPDGQIWFTEFNAGKIGRLTISTPPTAAGVDGQAGVGTVEEQRVLIEGEKSDNIVKAGRTIIFNVVTPQFDYDAYFVETANAPCELTCPLNMVVVAPPGQITAVVDFVVGLKNCGTAPIQYSHLPGSMFPITTTTVTVTVSGQTCQFTVTVIEAPPIKGESTSNQPFSTHTNDPISTTTGELYEQLDPDIDLGGPIPLQFTRYYASRLASDGNLSSALGTNWAHNFDWTVKTPDANSAHVVSAHGRLHRFTRSGSTFTLQSPLQVPVQLVQNAGGYVFGNPLTEMIYTFNTAGRLTRIDDSRGNALTLTYSGNNLAQVSDGLGRTLSFTHDGGNHLTSVSDGPRTIRFTYAGNDLATAADALGNTTRYAYAAGGLLVSTTEPRGNIRYAQTFDGSGRVNSQTAGGANTTTLSFSTTTTTITEPTLVSRVHTHATTASGELTAATDAAGQNMQLGYDAAGRRTSTTDRLGDTSRMTYHPSSGKLAEMVSADGARTTFAYGSRTSSGITLYPLTAMTYPDGTSETLAVDGNGNVTSRTDRAGKVWSFTYNTRSQLLTATNPTGGVTTLTYNADGTVATSDDSDTSPTSYTYDAVRRPIRITRPGGATVQMEYDANDRVTAITDELGRRSTFVWDANGNPTQITDPAAKSTQLAYDALDRVVQITDRLGAMSRRTFDPRELPATVVDQNNNTIRFTHDARRRLTGVTDGGGKQWATGYDDEAVIRSATNPLNQTVSLSTNKLGLLTSVTDALGGTARWDRDSMQRVTAIVDPVSRTTGYAFDTRGLVTSVTRPAIGTASFTRNDLGLISSIRDLKSETWQRLYTPLGRLLSMRDPLSRSTSYTFDTRGRLSTITFPDGVQKTNTWDATSNLARAAYSGGPDHPYAYDSLNRLTSTTGLAIGYDAEGRPTSTVTNGVTSVATFDAGGRLTNVTYHNGAFSVRYEFDARDLLTRVSDTWTNTQVTFEYDDASRLTRISRPSGVNTTYTYDSAGRLIRIQDGGILDLQYTLNAAGEVTREETLTPLDPAAGASAVPNATYGYDAASQISSSGYSSDARGRLISSPLHTFRWDGASRVVGIDNVNLTYDGLGNLLSRGATTYFYNAAIGMNPILAEGSGSAMTRAYVWTPGGGLLYSIEIASRTLAHYHFDRIGSTMAITNSTGAVTDAYAYDPYGVPLGRMGSSTQPFTFAGRWGVRAEPAAGLYHMRARYYDPSTARFLSRDPVVSTSPQAINPYQYARNAPTTYVDPAGRREGVSDVFSEQRIASDFALQVLFGDPDFVLTPRYDDEYVRKQKEYLLMLLDQQAGDAAEDQELRDAEEVELGTPPPAGEELEPSDPFPSRIPVRVEWPRPAAGPTTESESPYVGQHHAEMKRLMKRFADPELRKIGRNPLGVGKGRPIFDLSDSLSGFPLLSNRQSTWIYFRPMTLTGQLGENVTAQVTGGSLERVPFKFGVSGDSRFRF
jgi:RHS repeat-associated protein